MIAGNRPSNFHLRSAHPRERFELRAGQQALDLGAQARSTQILDDVVPPLTPARLPDVDDDLGTIAQVIVGEARIEGRAF